MRVIVRIGSGGLLLAVAGCGGGGGTQSTPAPPVQSSPPVTTPPVNTPPTTVTTATPPVIVTGGANDTAEYRASTGAQQANAIVAYDAGATGKNVIAAIIDGGIDQTNSEFAGRISAASAATAGNGTIQDEGGHGTAVAGVLGAARNGSAVQGIAYDATLLVIRSDTPGTCDKEDGCSHTDTAIGRGIDIAVANGARVINMSLGGSAPSVSLQASIAKATAAGVVIVIAAGNDASAEPDPFAAIATNDAVAHGLVVIAGATDQTGTIADFSDRAGSGASHYLTALGVRVRSFDQTGAQFLFSGTSFSAPLISGAVALLAQAFPNLTGAQIVDLLFASADDVGASGVDAIYGNGRLDLVRAFQPRGTTSIAGSKIAVSLTDNGMTSAPMGDAAAKTGAGTVILDGYGRAYALDLGRTLGRVAPALRLAPALSQQSRSLAMAAGGAMVAVTVAATPAGGATLARLSLNGSDATAARARSGFVATRLGGNDVALGFGQTGTALARTLRGQGGEPFLVAADPLDPGFAATPRTAAALRRDVAGFTMTLSAEQGDARIPVTTGRPNEWRGFGYDQVAAGVDRRIGALTLGTRWSRLIEQATVLGARFGSAFGGGGARSDVIDATASLASGAWRLDATARRSWTRTGGGVARGRLTGSAYAIDLARGGLIARGDAFALRVAQPLRVERGGFAIDLPTAYDYGTGVTATARQTIDLTPRGREIDVEAAYGLPLGPGRLVTNLFWRRDPGHIAASPDDVGAALRWGFGF